MKLLLNEIKRRTIRVVCAIGVLMLTYTPILAQNIDYLAKAKEFLAQGDCERAEYAYQDYKRSHPTGDTEVERRIAECGKEPQKTIPDGYVDLGLPSRTLWKAKDENGGIGGYYTHNEAEQLFGDQIPSQTQWEELVTYCTWSYLADNSYFKVQGPNDNYIVFPLREYKSETYYQNDKGSFKSSKVENCGLYWSSTENGSSVWIMHFNYISRKVEEHTFETPFSCYSVRLVK